MVTQAEIDAVNQRILSGPDTPARRFLEQRLRPPTPDPTPPPPKPLQEQLDALNGKREDSVPKPIAEPMELTGEPVAFDLNDPELGTVEED